MASPLSDREISFSEQELQELQASLNNRASLSSAGRPRQRPPAPVVARRKALEQDSAKGTVTETSSHGADRGTDAAAQPAQDDRPERVSILLSALKTSPPQSPGRRGQGAVVLPVPDPDLLATPTLEQADSPTPPVVVPADEAQDPNAEGLDEETLELPAAEVEDADPPEAESEEIATGPPVVPAKGADADSAAAVESPDQAKAAEESGKGAVAPFPLAADLVAAPVEAAQRELEVDIDIDEEESAPRPGAASETELSGEDIEEVATARQLKTDGSPFVQPPAHGDSPEVRLRMGSQDGLLGPDDQGIMTSAMPDRGTVAAPIVSRTASGRSDALGGGSSSSATRPPLPPNGQLGPDQPVANKSQRPPPAPAAEGPKQRQSASKRVPTAEIAQVGPWFEGVFSEDYPRTAPDVTPRKTASEVDFLLATLRPTKDSRILDFGCGWGRHCIELASRGYQITGIDSSKSLLELAGHEARRRQVDPTLVHQDFRDFEEINSYDAAYCLNTSFGYFEDDANRKVIQSLARALRQGGRLLLEVANRDYLVKDLPRRVGWEGDSCIVVEEVDFSFFTSRLRNKRSIFYSDGRHVEHDISIRMYSLHDLGKLLHHAGFRVVEVSGHMAHRALFFGNLSRQLIVLAEKRPGQ